MPNLPVFAKSKPKGKYSAKIDLSAFNKQVKKVIHKQSETKSYLDNVSGQNLYNDFVYAQNLNYGISQGVNSEQIIGEKLFVKNIRVKGQVTSLCGTTPSNGQLAYRVLIVRTKKALTSSWSAVTFSDIFRGSTTAVASRAMVDLHKVDVIYDKTKIIGQPNNSAVAMMSHVDFNIKINKNHFCDQDNSGYFKDKNYYLIITAHKEDSGVLANVGYLRATWTVNFKDT